MRLREKPTKEHTEGHATALDHFALIEMVEMLRTADGGELMRRFLGGMLQAVVDAEATSHISAGLHELSETRATQRGTVQVSADNALAESFNASLERETLQGAARWASAQQTAAFKCSRGSPATTLNDGTPTAAARGQHHENTTTAVTQQPAA